MLVPPAPREEILLRTKLSPPRRQRRVLPRPELTALLRQARDYRLTLVQAGTGYSKTTALAALDGGEMPLFWYSVGEPDADPQRFLAYLIAACRARLPALSDRPLAALAERGGEGSRAPWSAPLDTLINALDEALPGPALLVLDDYHLVAGVPEIGALVERFLTYLPPDLHVIIATRQAPAWPALVGWRARGEVLEITRAALAFRPAEIDALFRDIYQLPLAPEDLAALAAWTEGWPIALQLAWQGLRGPPARRPADLIGQGSLSLGALFDHLAREVLDGQPPAVAAFLRQTAVLRELTPAACAAVQDTPDCGEDSAALLERLHGLDLFIVALGERHYRYHNLFHEFLLQQSAADPAAHRARQRRAAEFFHTRGEFEEEIYHRLAASELAEAATAISTAGDAALQAGWLSTVTTWIDALPPDVLADHPLLQAYLGDVCRLQSRFDAALAWYTQAEATWRARNEPAGISRALRGQALVYLDTVRPAQAESFLEEALRLTDGIADREARARLLELLAENKLNMGQPDAAETLRADARALREEGPGEDVLSVRVKLRTGRLAEAQRILDAWVDSERGHRHPPRAHRETLLILSLIHAFRGQAEQAFALAEEGIALGEQLGSPFVTAVAHMRLGHAWQLRRGLPQWHAGALDHAIRCYERAVALGDRLAVRRTRAEAMWGLTRIYGFLGDLESARRTAADGLDTAQRAGDSWVGAHIELALGASLVLAGYAADALPILGRVLGAFRACGDPLGRAATRAWLSLAYRDLRQPELFAASVDDLLALCETHGYDFLLTAPNFLGPPDPRSFVPVLLDARARRLRPAYAAHLLAQSGLTGIQVHPGYRLRVETLGAFRVWRGEGEVLAHEWQRDKARQLFQLLLTHRERRLQKDEIVEYLWPQLTPEAAERDFKVALNALNKALEPGRAPEAPFAFVVREGTAYGIRAEADLWLDAAVFADECRAAAQLLAAGPTDAALDRGRAALALYNGPYLPDTLYHDWAGAERERLLALFVRTADKLAGALVARGRDDEALALVERLLGHDPCCERAYRWLMLIHARQADRPQVLRAYQRCVRAMADQLDLEPSAATTDLHRRLMQGGDPPVTVV